MTEMTCATCSASGLSPMPTLRLRLPPIEGALTYLQRIDVTRIYSDQGCLWLEFCDAMAVWLSAVIGAVNVRVVHTNSCAIADKRELCARALHRGRMKRASVGAETAGSRF